MPNSFKTYFEESNYYNETLHPQFWDEFEFKEDKIDIRIKKLYFCWH